MNTDIQEEIQLPIVPDKSNLLIILMPVVFGLLAYVVLSWSGHVDFTFQLPLSILIGVSSYALVAPFLLHFSKFVVHPENKNMEYSLWVTCAMIVGTTAVSVVNKCFLQEKPTSLALVPFAVSALLSICLIVVVGFAQWLAHRRVTLREGYVLEVDGSLYFAGTPMQLLACGLPDSQRVSPIISKILVNHIMLLTFMDGQKHKYILRDVKARINCRTSPVSLQGNSLGSLKRELEEKVEERIKLIASRGYMDALREKNTIDMVWIRFGQFEITASWIMSEVLAQMWSDK